MTPDELVADPPRVHEDPPGRIHGDWALSGEALRFIADTVGPGATTLETGAGLSSALLLLLGCEHTVVTVDPGEIDRLHEYCRRSDIPLERARFLVGNSAWVLPAADLPDLDFVLIDGSHAFPIPFLDWYYTAGALREGGLVMVDDVQLWPCGTLAGYLDEEPGWRLEGRPDRTAVFRKTAPFDPLRSWVLQPFTTRRSLVWSDGAWRPFDSGAEAGTAAPNGT
jgi:predicted O-methyltransferase YrrM